MGKRKNKKQRPPSRPASTPVRSLPRNRPELPAAQQGAGLLPGPPPMQRKRSQSDPAPRRRPQNADRQRPERRNQAKDGAQRFAELATAVRERFDPEVQAAQDPAQQPEAPKKGFWARLFCCGTSEPADA